MSDQLDLVGKPDRPYMAVTGRELAEIIHVTPGRVSQLAKKGMPRTAGRLYDLRTAIPWYVDQMRGSSDVREELARVQTEKLKLDIAQVGSGLYQLEQLWPHIEQNLAQLQTELSNLPFEVTTNAELQARIRDGINAVLERCSQRLGDSGSLAPGSTRAGAIAERKRRRVGKGKRSSR